MKTKFKLLAVVAVIICALTMTGVVNAEATLKVGDPAPPHTPAKWIKGDAVETFAAGKVYVVEFWATWCGPCITSIPHLSQLQAKFKDDVIFIGQNCSEDDPAAVEEFVRKMGDKMAYRVALDDNDRVHKSWMAAADQHGIPTAFVVDKTGKIAFIGHPLELDEPLPLIIAGNFDAKKYAADKAAIANMDAKIHQAIKSGETDDALSIIDDVLEKFPQKSDHFAMHKYNLLLGEKKDYAAASAFGAKLLQQFHNDSELLNELSWGIVDPESEISKRDLDLAQKAAARANELTKGENAAILDTLARVYYWKGDLDRAITLQTQAIEKAGQRNLKAQLQEVLGEYNAKKNSKTK